MNDYLFLLTYRLSQEKIRIEFTVHAESETDARIKALYKAVELRKERSGYFGTSGSVELVDTQSST